MAAVSPLADFSFDYQDLLLRRAQRKVATTSRLLPCFPVSEKERG
jgi:hypothetical protein